MDIIRIIRCTAVFFFLNIIFFTHEVYAREALELDQKCVVNILNRTIFANPNGDFMMDNIPSTLGQVRARASCQRESTTNPGQFVTVSAQSDYFTVVNNGKVDVGQFFTGDDNPVPVALNFRQTGPITFTALESTQNVQVLARWANGNTKDVTAASAGTNYASANPAIVSVNSAGTLTANAAGSTLITARKDGVLAVLVVRVVTSGDTDGDGIPDEIELANGLDPNDPVDAYEDHDGDGISSRNEYLVYGTGLLIADSDNDGINDGEEVKPGDDGYVTNPLLSDTDGDGVSDSLEIMADTNPTDGNSVNYSGLLVGITVTPPTAVLYYNSIETEASTQLQVTGQLLDGNTINLTTAARGTTYSSSDLTVASFGATPGQVFAGKAGTATITVSNSGFTQKVAITTYVFTPQVLTYLDLGITANNLAIDGSYAYVATTTGFSIVDIGNPSSPVFISSTLGSNSFDVKYHSGFVYAANASGVDVYDVSFAYVPVKVYSIDTSGAAYDMAIEGDVLAVATATQGVQLYDITTAQLPMYLSAVTGMGAVDAVDLSPDLMVAIGTNNRVYAIDYADPLFPVLKSSVAVNGVVELAIKDKVAFLAASNSNHWSSVDFSNITSPVFKASGTQFNPTGIVIVDKFALYADTLFVSAVPIVNVDNVSAPAYTALINMSRYGDKDCNNIDANKTLALCTSGTRLYINEYRKESDTKGIPPVVTITSPLASAVIEQGRFYTFSADVTDDVQVASVEFWVDGQKVATDMGAPYFVSFVEPRDAVMLNLKAVATDIGNNKTERSLNFNVQPLSPVNEVLNNVVNTTITGDLLYYGLTMQNSTLQSTKVLETVGSMTVNGSGTSSLTVDQLKVGGDLIIDGVALTLKTSKPVIVNGNVQIINGGSLVVAKGANNSAVYYPLNLQVVGDVEIDATSSIDAIGAGYAANATAAYVWPGTSVANLYNSATAAGSHGGLRYGMATGAYDSYQRARYAGNGGDYFDANITGYGGGFIEIKANTLTLEGAILANGDNGDDIGGAGGGVHIEVTNLQGAGLIEASGGMGKTTTQDLAGAGGRISLYVEDDTQFTGKTLAFAGYNYNSQESGAGTVYIQRADETAGHLVLDNGKRVAALNSTPLTGIGQHAIQSAIQNGDNSWTITVAGTPWLSGSAVIDFKGYQVSLDAGDAFADSYEILANTSNTLTIITNGRDVSALVGNTLQGVSIFETVNVKEGASLDKGVNRVDVRDTTNSITQDLATVDTSEVLFGELRLKGVIFGVKRDQAVHILRNAKFSGSAGIDGANTSETLGPVASKLIIDGKLDIGLGVTIDVSGDGYSSSGNDYGHVWPDGALAASRGSGRSGCHAGERHDTDGDQINCGYGRYDRARFPGSAGGYYSTANPGNGGGVLEITASALILNGSIKANGLSGAYNAGAGGSIHLDVGQLSGTGSVSANGDFGKYGGYIASGAGRISVYVEDDSNFTGSYSAKGGSDTYYNLSGGAGTIYVKKAAESYGHLTVDNQGAVAAPKSTRLRTVGVRTISAISQIDNTTWMITVNSGTAWSETDESRDVGLQGLLVDLDNSSEEGPLYEIIENGADWITVKVGSGQQAPDTLGINLGTTQLIGVHVFKSLTVINGGSLDVGDDRLVTTAATDIHITNARWDTRSTIIEGSLILDNSDAIVKLPYGSSGEIHIKGDLTLKNGSTFSAHDPSSTSLFALKLKVDGQIFVDSISTIDVSGDGYSSSGNDYGHVWPDGALAASRGSGRSGCHAGERHDTDGDQINCGYGRYDRARFPGSAGGYYSTANPGNGGGVLEITASALILNGSIKANGLSGAYNAGAGGSIHLDVGQLSGTGSVSANGDFGKYGYHIASGAGRISVYVEDDSNFTGSYSAKGGSDTYYKLYGGAGTIYVKKAAESYGHLTVDNGGAVAAPKSTRLRTVGVRTISAISQIDNTTWMITVNSGTAWSETDESRDVGLQGLLVDLDNSSEEGPLYEIIENGADWITVKVGSGQQAPDTLGIDLGATQLIGVHVFESLKVANGGDLDVGDDRVDIVGTGITLANAKMSLGKVSYFGSLSLNQSSLTVKGLSVQGDLVMNSSSIVQVNGSPIVINGDLTLLNSSTMTMNTSVVAPSALRIDAAGAISIDGSSSIDVSGDGYGGAAFNQSYVWPSGTVISYLTGRSGCHAGERFDTGVDQINCGYGRYDKARFAGSGGTNYNGDSGAGGGIASIKANALILNGSIKANGMPGNAIGGAGGSIDIDIVEFSGSGSVSANGGNATSADYYGAGGGRISLNVGDNTGYTGTLSAKGGVNPAGVSPGGAGTVYVKRTTESYGHLKVDNGGKMAQTNSTRLRYVNTQTISAVEDLYNGIWKVTVSGSPWSATNETQDIGLQGLLVDLDNGTEDGPLYEIIESGDNWIRVKAGVNQITPDVLGIVPGMTQLVGVHIFEELNVANGASLYAGDDRIEVKDTDFTLVNGRLSLGKVSYPGSLSLTSSSLTVQSLSVNGDLAMNASNIVLTQSNPVRVEGNVNLVGSSTMSTSSSTVPVSLLLKASGNVSIDELSSIDVSGDGYGGAAFNQSYVWPSGGIISYLTGRSGCHAGERFDTGVDQINCGYGRYDKARFAGSGGTNYSGDSGAGGGIASIKANALILNGSIKANGMPGNAIGGAGGSIDIDIVEFSGSGSVFANGGNATSAGYFGAGGGRISLYVEDDTGYTGTLSAKGGVNPAGASPGGAGTVYVKRTSESYGHLKVDNGGKMAQTNSTQLRVVGNPVINMLEELGDGRWKVTVNNTSGWLATNETLDQGLQGVLVDLDSSTEDGPLFEVVENGTNWLVVKPESDQDIPDTLGIVGGQTRLLGVHVFESLAVSSGASLYAGEDRIEIRNSGLSLINSKLNIGNVVFAGPGNLEISGSSLVLSMDAPVKVDGDIILSNQSVVTTMADGIDPIGVRLEASGTINIANGSNIDVTNKGYGLELYNKPYVWPSGSVSYSTGRSGCNGGQRFDVGGDNVDCGYGRYDRARFAGSGGFNLAQGVGGGIVDIKSANLVLNGNIKANSTGGNDTYIAGAGGAIHIDVGTMSGSGTISANGGSASNTSYSGAGGGRISLYVEDDSGFAGTMQAYGGTALGYNAGGAGTVYVKRATESYGHLNVENGGKSAQTSSTRIRTVGVRAVSAIMPVDSKTWRITVNTGTAWPVTDEALDIGLQDLWVDLDRTTIEGPYYKIISNTSNQLVLEVPDGETIPSTYIDKELHGVHFFKSYSVTNGASLYYGLDRVITLP